MNYLDKLEILKGSVDDWNEYRRVNPDEVIGYSGVDLSDTDLSNANLSGVALCNSNLRGVNFSGANLMWVDFSGSILRGVNFSGSFLKGSNFSGANLTRSLLTKADLRGAILKGLDFTDAMLTWSDFTGADLSNSTLHKALLGKCDFSNANLSGANLSGAYLGAVKFCGARLVQANLSESQVHSTLFINCDLSDAIGLKTCRHTGPSYLDHDTAQMSGPLPLVFLQGCGLSDQQIDYLNALHTQAIQYYSCFISYSTKDDDFANRLYADLQREGVRCWFAKKDIQGGQKIIEQIDRAIRYHEKLLLVLSNESMNSEWVKTEIAKARKREVHEGCRVLFPISIVDFETIKQWECFDGDTGKDSAREIREYYIPDFSKWINHSDYQREFDRLLRDLKQEHELKG